MPVEVKRLFLDGPDARSRLAPQLGHTGIDEVAAFRNAEAENRHGEIGQAHIAQPAAATDPDAGVVGTFHLAIYNRQTFRNATRIISELAEHAFQLRFVFSHFLARSQRCSRNAETKLLAFANFFTGEQCDYLADQSGAVGLVFVKDAAQHGTPRLLVKEVGEALRLIAVDDDLGILNQMWDALLLE